jgi:hypothetical protein
MPRFLAGRLIWLLAATLFLLIPALFNGFPIMHPDTATYMVSGFTVETPFDRPITYGLFLRLTSLNGLTLWTVILTQALLLAFVLLDLQREVLGQWFSPAKGAVLVAVLALLTGAAWVCCQVMPDVFSPILAITVVLIILCDPGRKRRLAGLYFLFFLSTAMHLSHPTFVLALLVLMLVARLAGLFALPVSGRRLAVMGLLAVASFATMGSAFSKARHVFFMGALLEHGILRPYLEEHCPRDSFALCAYRDSLPEKAWQFMWEPASPLYRLGGWKATKPEFTRIINGTLTQPKYLGMHVKASVEATAWQLVRFRVGDGNTVWFAPGTPMHRYIALYFPGDLSAFEKAEENKRDVRFMNAVNPWFNAVVVAAAIFLAVLAVRWRGLSDRYKTAALILLLAVFLNAWASGTFAMAVDRLGSKMMWILPMLAILGMLEMIKVERVEKD